MEIGIAASTITIVKLTYDLALQVKELVQSAKQSDENLKELEDNLASLGIILEEAITLYGSDKGSSYSTSEQKLRQTLRKVVSRCKGDLTKFKAELNDLLSHANWALAAWRHRAAAPILARIKISVSNHHQVLSTLMQLLQGVQMHEMIEMIRTLTNKPAQGTTTDSMISEVAEALEQKQDSESEEGICMVGTLAGGKEPDDNEESNENGRRLLEAIEEGNHDKFQSLLHDGVTSLKEKDDRDRTPLLLAAHLGKTDMVKKLLDYDADGKFADGRHVGVQRDTISDEPTPSCEHGNVDEASANPNHHQIDFNATDKLGRNALHYCAEFDMCDTANCLLDHGVNVNAPDVGGYPPAYYPIKNRKYFATELLLSRGATTEFKQPPATSHEIEQLLKKSASDDPSTSGTSQPQSGAGSGLNVAYRFYQCRPAARRILRFSLLECASIDRAQDVSTNALMVSWVFHHQSLSAVKSLVSHTSMGQAELQHRINLYKQLQRTDHPKLSQCIAGELDNDGRI
ncbi:MAG: hypothetical protein Q9210_003723 [Variospora velana]